MDVSFDNVLEKVGLPFAKIKGSTKRAEVLETLAKRAGIEADIITVAMWETQWDKRLEDEAAAQHKPPPTAQPYKAPAAAASTEAVPPAAAQSSSSSSSSPAAPQEVTFTDPIKGSKLKFMPVEGSTTALCYSVNGEKRPPFTKMRLTLHSKGPRLEFPELSTAATVAWDASQNILSRLKKLADVRGVANNIPVGGVVSKPEKRTRQPRNAPAAAPTTSSSNSSAPAAQAMPPASYDSHVPPQAPPPPPPTITVGQGSPSPVQLDPQYAHQHQRQHHQSHPQYAHQHQHHQVPQPQQPPPPPMPTADAPPPQPTISISVPDGEILNIPSSCISHVVHANYTDGYHFLPVGKNVAALLQNGGLSFQVTRQILGVPEQWPQPQTTNGMHAKRLEIQYVPLSSPPPPPPQGMPQGSPYMHPNPGSSQHLHQAVRAGSMLSIPRASLSGIPIDAADNPPTENDEDADTLTERSNASYRHNPYGTSPTVAQPASRQGTFGIDHYTADEFSESSFGAMTTESLTRRPSEATNGDFSRYAEPMNRPGRANISIPRGEWLHLPPGTAVRIVRAVYGEGQRWLKATPVVQAAFKDGGIQGLFVSEESLGLEDPSPGMPKTLVVVYRPVEENANVAAPAAPSMPQPDAHGGGLENTVSSVDLGGTQGSLPYYSQDCPPSPPPQPRHVAAPHMPYMPHDQTPPPPPPPPDGRGGYHNPPQPQVQMQPPM